MPANLTDFGAIPGNDSAAAIQTNAQAFRDAFDSGARRLLIPAGTWFFEEIMYLGNPWLPVGVEIFGEGREGQTNLVYRPSDTAIPAFSFTPDSSRSTLRDFRLSGPSENVVNRPPRGIGISLEHSLHNHVHDVVIWDFDVGIVFSAGVSPYSGNNYVERFEVNRCRTGVLAADLTNACVLENGRIFHSVVLYDDTDPGGAREEGIGLDVAGSPVLPPTVTPNQTPFVTGRAATELAIAVTTTEHVYQDFVVDSGVRTVTVGFRYRLLDSGPNAFRVDLYEPSSDTRLGFFSDADPEPTRWRTRSLTGRFDGLAGPGPKTLRVRVFPFAGAEGDIGGQRVLVDSIWVVEGEYAATYRPYTDGVELLAGDDREQFFAGTANATVGPSEAMPAQVPSNAIGMTVEMQVQGSDATATRTILRVDDRSGASPVRGVHALADGRPSLIDYTLPLVPGAPPRWSVLGAGPGNTVDYSVRLKAWILRL